LGPVEPPSLGRVGAMDEPSAVEGEALAAEPVDGVDASQDGRPQESITQPAKLLRIASMVRELLEDTRQASLDEPGRARLREIYERSLAELSEAVSADQREELEA